MTSSRRQAAPITGIDTGDDGWFIVYNGPETIYTCTTLSSEFTYDIRVCAANFQGNFSEPSPVLSFTTLNRNDTSNQITSRNVMNMFTVECTGDICVGDTILLTERLFLKPKVGSSSAPAVVVQEGSTYVDPGLLSATAVRGTTNASSSQRPLSASATQGRSMLKSKTRPGSATATGVNMFAANTSGANNLARSSVTSIHSTGHGGIGGTSGIGSGGLDDDMVSITENGKFLGERTIAAFVSKDNYRTLRDLLNQRKLNMIDNQREFASLRKLWLEVIWQKSSTDSVKAYELKPNEILERVQNHLECFEIFRLPWKDEDQRKSLMQEWSILSDCFIAADT